MNQKEFSKIVSYLVKNFQVYSTQEENNQIAVKELLDPKKVALAKRLPFYPWKRFFLPEDECLFEYENNILKIPLNPPLKKGESLIASRMLDISGVPPAIKSPFNKGGRRGFNIALLGINPVDLNAILLYDKVFASDPYYQQRMMNTLIIGYGLETEMLDGSARTITKNDLKHLRFDIFLTEQPTANSQQTTINRHPELVSGSQEMPKRVETSSFRYAQMRHDENKINTIYQVFTGSKKGEEILKQIGYSEQDARYIGRTARYKEYKRVEYAGQKYSQEWEEKMRLRRDKLKNHHNQRIWEELGKICIDCGKCTIACPTCFCFRIDDNPSLEASCGIRQRCWDSCYYQEFSEVAGPSTSLGQAPKFLSNTAQKIHFWYFHKFGRIPDEHNMMGCIGCHRCFHVCPVGIDIRKVMEEMEKN